MEENAPQNLPPSLPPFSLRPDPRVYFPVPSHEPVWNILRTTTALGRGMIVILGDAGSGKTLLIQRLVDVLPETRKGVLLHHPDCSGKRFLRNLIAAIRPPGDDTPLPEDPTPEALTQAVEARAAHSHRLLVAVDDAHRLSPENLETLSLLLGNVEDEDQPVQLLLVGRAELQEVIVSSPMVECLTRAITGTAVLSPLTRAEQRAYASHLLKHLFPEKVEISWAAWQGIHYFGGGIPGRINAILSAALRLALEQRREGEGMRIGSAVFHKAVLPLDSNQTYRRAWRWPAVTAAVILAVGTGALLGGRALAPVQEKLVLVAASSVTPDADASAPLSPPPPPPPRKEDPPKGSAAKAAPAAIQPPNLALALSRQDPFTRSGGTTPPGTEVPPAGGGKPPAPPEPPREGKNAAPEPAEEVKSPLPPVGSEPPAPARDKADPVEADKSAKAPVKPAPTKEEPAVSGKGKEKSPAPAKSRKEEPRKEEPKAAAPASFIVQAGAYGTKEFAEGVAKRMAALGYPASIRETTGKEGRRFHAVRIPFPDQTSAQQAMDKIHAKEVNIPLLVIPPPGFKK